MHGGFKPLVNPPTHVGDVDWINTTEERGLARVRWQIRRSMADQLEAGQWPEEILLPPDSCLMD